WHDRDLIAGRVGDGQLDGVGLVGEVDRLAGGDHHAGLNLEQPGDQLAEHQDDQPGVDEQNAEAVRRELEADGVGGDEVKKQQAAEGPAGGEREASADGHGLGQEEEYLAEADEQLQRHPDVEGAEVVANDGPEAVVDLGERAAEDQNDRQHE